MPRDHSLAGVGRVHKDGLYSLTFVSLNAGSSVQVAQETMLRKHGILWRRLKTDMVRIAGRRPCVHNVSQSVGLTYCCQTCSAH